MPGRFTGFRPDPHYDRRGHIGSAWRKRVLVGRSVPESASLAEHYVPTSQVANDCTAQTGRQMARIRAAVQGITIPKLSSFFAYYNLRARHRWMRGEALRDAGGYPRSMIWSFAKFGVCLESEWPSTLVENVNVSPPAMIRLKAKAIKVTIRPIYDSGDALVHRVKDSLAKGYPIGIALQIDEAFLKLEQPLLIQPPTSPLDMGHMVTGTGYDEHGLFIGNSHTINWGNNGQAKISWSYVRRCRYVCDCPRVSIRAAA